MSRLSRRADRQFGPRARVAGAAWRRRGDEPRAGAAYPVRVALYQLDDPGPLVEPTLIVALDGWVDAGSAATAAATLVAVGGTVVATFDADRVYDYRARRPTLDIVDGRLTELDWPEFKIRLVRTGGRDVLVLVGPEPDYRWPSLSQAISDVARTLGVREWITLGAIPAAVPHTRPVPILGTSSRAGLLRGDIRPGPSGILRVPAALVSVLEMQAGRDGIDAVGYFAQVPHYVSGPYPAAAVELLAAVERHVGIEVDRSMLVEEAVQLRTRLDAATAADDNTRSYVERLESMVDEERLPAGDDLISEIEQFLRDQGSQRS
jgi:proteasome assembly chaperone (PAC2) family protein